MRHSTRRRFRSGFGRTLGVAAVVVALLALAPAVHAAPGDFSGLQTTAATVGRALAGALLIIGALVAGGAIILGSREAGHHAKNFFMGAFFLGMIAMGTGLWTMVSGWFGGAGQ